MRLRNAVLMLLIAMFLGEAALARPVVSRGAETLNWNTKRIGKVVAGGSFLYYPSRTTVIEGRACLIGNLFNFDVHDDFAFDIDETVELKVESYLQRFQQGSLCLMGSELHLSKVESLVIEARSTINQSIGQLNRIE